MATELIYGQVKKSYRRRKLVRVTHVMRLGTETTLEAALLGLGFTGRLHTAIIPRVNLTLRDGVAALARRSWATAKPAPQLLVHLQWWRGDPHGCRVLMHRYEWRSYSPESEVASVWHNATGSVLRLWQQGERTDDGQRGKSSAIPCRQYHAQPVEGHRSEKHLCDMAEAA